MGLQGEERSPEGLEEGARVALAKEGALLIPGRPLGPRRGHFLLESGHHGNLWLDLNSLFLRPAALLPNGLALCAAGVPLSSPLASD